MAKKQTTILFETDYAKEAVYCGIKSGLFTMLLLFSGIIYANPTDADSGYYFQAVQAYETGDYHYALSLFEAAEADSEVYMIRNPQAHFKKAYCYYQTENYENAFTAFQHENAAVEGLADYNAFLAIRALLARADSSTALKKLITFKQQYPKTPLRIPADSLLAELYFQKKMWSQANTIYQRLLKYRGFDKGDIYGKLIHIARARQHFKTMESHSFKLIRKYPFHRNAKKAYQDIIDKYQDQAIPAAKFKNLFRYLGKTGQFQKIDQLLARQAELVGQSEQIRWLSIRKLYLQKQYWATFQACKSRRSTFKSARYLREVDIHIARCNMRLGFTKKAIEAYDTFQQRYPADGLSPEVVWVTAWLCEQEGDIEGARKYYRRIIRQYPRYEFVKEAKFRIGLSHYRQDSIATAQAVWQKHLTAERNDDWQTRYKYWIAKTYLKQDSLNNYLKYLHGITDEPFDDYYNLKAFLLTRNGSEIRQFVDSLLWEMHHKQTSYLANYLTYFERPLLVQDLLGEKYAQRELNTLAASLRKPDWEMTFALGEVNERMQNFGRAYRLYRKVFLENFVAKDWTEWVFLFKYLYPFYFDREVNAYAQKWNITPASIWAVMKKESAFEPVIMSYANAYGLMQIIPPTANRLSDDLGLSLEDVRELYNPDTNIHLGSYYLAELLKRYDGNLYHALAAYNAGEHRVDRWRKTMDIADDDFFMENIEFEQTRKYVRGVMKFYWTYHLLIHPYEIPEDLSSFPEKVAREPWLR